MTMLTTFSDSDRVIINGPHERREVAAACLAHQPFGFTAEMVTALKQCIDDGERWRAQHGWSQPNGWRDEERKLAREAVERIAALLPEAR